MLSNFRRSIAAALALLLPLAMTGGASADVSKPRRGESFSWQLQGRVAAATLRADVIDIDLFDTAESTIASMKRRGAYVVCYVSVGSWENWRPDRRAFPSGAIGRAYDGWAGERWLDISRIDLIGPALTARMDLAVSKGCDAIEPDNLDAYEQGRAETGFSLTRSDQVRFIRWLTSEAHKRDLAIGLKNVPEFAASLGTRMDFAVTEDCAVWDFCADYRVMLNRGIAVFHVHYTDTDVDFDEVCRTADRRETHILKRRSLDGWVRTCAEVR